MGLFVFQHAEGLPPVGVRVRDGAERFLAQSVADEGKGPVGPAGAASSGLSSEATCKDSLQVRQEGQRQVRRRLKAYSLPMILAVGYRVRSPRGTQFRQRATAHLEEYLVKGFVMDDQRLKDPGGADYFDELRPDGWPTPSRFRRCSCSVNSGLYSIRTHG